MTTAITARTVAIALLAAGLAACTAAEGPVKPGKWEFSVLVPGGMHLPAGVRPPPGVTIGPEGTTVSTTECITAANPLPPNARGPSTPREANRPCKIDKTEVVGGTASWSWTCATPAVTLHADGVVHYHGETLDGQIRIRVVNAGRPPIDTAQGMTGRYLGPC